MFNLFKTSIPESIRPHAQAIMDALDAGKFTDNVPIFRGVRSFHLRSSNGIRLFVTHPEEWPGEVYRYVSVDGPVSYSDEDFNKAEKEAITNKTIKVFYRNMDKENAKRDIKLQQLLEKA